MTKNKSSWRFLALLLALLMFGSITLISEPIKAEEDKALVELTDAEGKVGETVDVYFNISNNTQGINMLGFIVSWDENELKLLENEKLSEKFEYVVNKISKNKHEFLLVYTGSNNRADNFEEASVKLAKLSFEILKTDSENISVNLEAKDDGIAKIKAGIAPVPVPHTSKGATITVKKATIEEPEPETPLLLKLTDQEVEAGKEFTVELKVSGNTGFCSIWKMIKWNEDEFNLVDLKTDLNSPDLDDKTKFWNESDGGEYNKNANPHYLVWGTGNFENLMTQKITLATFTFKANKDLAAGDYGIFLNDHPYIPSLAYPVTSRIDDIPLSFGPVPHTSESATITVKAAAEEPDPEEPDPDTPDPEEPEEIKTLIKELFIIDGATEISEEDVKNAVNANNEFVTAKGERASLVEDSKSNVQLSDDGNLAMVDLEVKVDEKNLPWTVELSISPTVDAEIVLHANGFIIESGSGHKLEQAEINNAVKIAYNGKKYDGLISKAVAFPDLNRVNDKLNKLEGNLKSASEYITVTVEYKEPDIVVNSYAGTAAKSEGEGTKKLSIKVPVFIYAPQETPETPDTPPQPSESENKTEENKEQKSITRWIPMNYGQSISYNAPRVQEEKVDAAKVQVTSTQQNIPATGESGRPVQLAIFFSILGLAVVAIRKFS